MTVDRERLFEQLDPPPGGVDRFRARLAEQGSSAAYPLRSLLAHRRPFLGLAGIAVAAVLILAVVARLPLDSEPDRSELDPAAGPSTAEAPRQASDPAGTPGDTPSGRGGLIDAPELDRLLGRTPPPVELEVTVNGEEANVVRIASSDPRIRVYRLASNGGVN